MVSDSVAILFRCLEVRSSNASTVSDSVRPLLRARQVPTNCPSTSKAPGAPTVFQIRRSLTHAFRSGIVC